MDYNQDLEITFLTARYQERALNGELVYILKHREVNIIQNE
jgi:hypothetical protein